MGEEPASFSPASLLDALNRHHVAYVLTGGVAARAHGATLRTGDVDVCPQDSEANVERLVPALGELEAKIYVDETTQALAAGTSAYEHLAAGARTARMRGVPVAVADLETLIAIKAAAGRPKDRQWLSQLRLIRDNGAQP